MVDVRIVATNRIQVRKGSEPQQEERFAHSGGVEQADRFVSFQMWRSAAEKEQDEYWVVKTERHRLRSMRRRRAMRSSACTPARDSTSSASSSPASFDLCLSSASAEERP